MSPFDTGFKLNGILLSAIAPNEAAAYGKANEAFRVLANDLGSGRSP